jgi:TolB protein
LIRADGTGLTRLSTNALSLSWSPDSRRIVFDNGGSLHLINPDGTGETPLTDNIGARQPEWAPDGTQIAFTGSAFLDIYTIKPDGTGLTNLTNSPAVDIEAKWSPDGSRIAFMTKESSTEYDIAIMNRDGTGFGVLTSSPDGDLEPEWSPDGDRLVFTRAGDSREVFVMNADGSNQIQVSDMPQEWAGEPDWRR